MSNLVYLAAAYAVAWLAICAYLFGIARRQRRLERELDRLQRTVEGKTQQGETVR